MTHQPFGGEFATAGRTVADEFGIRRSGWMNEFAKFETAVCMCLRCFECGQDSTKGPLIAGLAALAKVRPSPRLSRERAAKLSELASAGARVLDIRASLVHGIMTIGERENEPAA